MRSYEADVSQSQGRLLLASMSEVLAHRKGLLTYFWQIFLAGAARQMLSDVRTLFTLHDMLLLLSEELVKL